MANEVKQEVAVTVDELLAAPGCAVCDVPVPELGPGRIVQVRALTKREVQACRSRATTAGEDKPDLAALEREWFLAGLVAPTLTLEQYEALAAKPAGLYYRILTVILTESGLTEEVATRSRKQFLSRS